MQMPLAEFWEEFQDAAEDDARRREQIKREHAPRNRRKGR